MELMYEEPHPSGNRDRVVKTWNSIIDPTNESANVRNKTPLNSFMKFWDLFAEEREILKCLTRKRKRSAELISKDRG